MKIGSTNPCDRLERPRVSPAPPRGLSAEEIKRLLSHIPQNPPGLRDRAIIVTLALTGRRRSEVLNPKAKDIHILRHSAAKLRRDVGESIEDVTRFLDHSSLAVTTTYLRRLEGQEDRSWDKVAAALGI